MARMGDVSLAEKVPLLENTSEVEVNDLATFRFGTATPDPIKEDAGQGEKKVDGVSTSLNVDSNEKSEKDGEDGTEDKSKQDDQKQEDVRIRTKDIGIWRVFYQDKPWSYIPGMEIARQFKEIMETLPYVWQFTKEVWSLAPGYLVLWVLLRVWESIDSAISLWVTAKLLDTMQAVVLNGTVDVKAVRFAFMVKFLYFSSQWLQSWIYVNTRRALSSRVERYCGAKLLEAYTRMDLVTLQRKDVQSKLFKTSSTFIGDCIWNNFINIMDQMLVLVEVLSQGFFLGNFFKEQENGWLLAAVCIMPQIARGLMYTDEFGGAWFAYAANKAYRRLRAVGDTARNTFYFEEIITSGLGKYIEKEYHKAMEALGNMSHQSIYTIRWERVGFKEFINICLRDTALLYYLAAVARNPSSFSLTSLTVMRESANSFLYTIWRLFEREDTLNQKLRFIKDYYSLLEMKNAVVDGDIPYPTPEYCDFQGMKIEFRNVSMKYPKSTAFALKNLSFVIPAGSMVIIVGANGSGKTTTVSLLSRLMDVTSGEILIDDVPVKKYQVQSLRDSQAVLRQSYQHFPFSLKENIGMGDPNWLDEQDEERKEKRIMRAAKLGGADEIIDEVRGKDRKRREALNDLTMKGIDGNRSSTSLVWPSLSRRGSTDSTASNHNHNHNGNGNGNANGHNSNIKLNTLSESNLSQLNGSWEYPRRTALATEKIDTKKVEKVDKADPQYPPLTPIGENESGLDVNVTPVMTWEGSWQLHGSKLAEMSEEIEKGIELSGGQWQRLALARLFMRAEGDRVRLICTDEPSAALDPRAEFEVFQRLRTLKGRKTTRIFITHRFGHLTKHADLILCLKKGELVEMGNHEELMKENGEYATLYNIQAQAFATS